MEIVDGGKLFTHVPGEENRQVSGLKELYALTDAKAFEEMGKDAAALRKKKPEDRQAGHRGVQEPSMPPIWTR